MTRRSRMLLALLIVLVAIGGGVALALRSPAVIGYWFERQARARFAEFTSRSDFGDDGLHIILCGTASPLPDSNRAKACTMVVAGGRAYVVDTGPEFVEAARVDAVSGRPHRRRVSDALPFRPHR